MPNDALTLTTLPASLPRGPSKRATVVARGVRRTAAPTPAPARVAPRTAPPAKDATPESKVVPASIDIARGSDYAAECSPRSGLLAGVLAYGVFVAWLAFALA